MLLTGDYGMQDEYIMIECLNNFDGFSKSLNSVLHCILHHCGVGKLRLIPQNLCALNLKFFLCHLNLTFTESFLFSDNKKHLPFIIINSIVEKNCLINEYRYLK